MRMNKTQTGGLVVALALCACFSGTASDDVAFTKDISFAAPSAPSVSTSVGDSGLLPTISSSTSLDLSAAISKLNGIGTTTLSVPVDSLSGNEDLSWIQHVTVTVTPVNGFLQPATLVDADVSGSNMLNLPTQLSSSDLNNYFRSGSTTIAFSLMGNVPTNVSQDPTLTWKLQLHADIDINKSL